VKSSCHHLIPFLPFLLDHLRLPSLELDPIPILVKVKAKVTLRQAVYRQLVRLGFKPLETHDQMVFSTELLR
jgi:hypothetical protein